VEEAVAGTVELKPAYPNPSHGVTCIPVTLPEETQGELVMEDAMGRRIAVIHSGWMPAGDKNYFIQTQGLASGMYVLNLRVGDVHHVQRLMIR
jgi:hypothetical protein